MHTILTTLVLCLMVSIANAQEPEGYQHSGHPQFHDFYGGLYNKKKGVSCCHDKDCRPTQSQHTNSGWEVMINGVWWTVDSDTIIPISPKNFVQTIEELEGGKT